MRVVTGMLLSLVLAGGCGGQAKEAPPPRPAPVAKVAPVAPKVEAEVASCEAVARHIGELARAGEDFSRLPPDRQAAATKTMKSLEQDFVKECQEHAWPEEILACLLHTSSADEMANCSPPQNQDHRASKPATPSNGPTGIAECDEYLKEAEKFATCDKMPQEARDAQLQAIEAAKMGWASLRDPGVPREALDAAADACRQSTDALKQAWQAAGCVERD